MGSKTRSKRPHLRLQPPKVETNSLLALDTFSDSDIRQWEGIKDRFLRYHWNYYNELAYQRSKVTEQLNGALLSAAHSNKSFEFRRVVRFKWSLRPLDPSGSLKDPGQRFNIGDIDPAKFAMFPALYLASDNETALQEVLCQNYEKLPGGLDRNDFALAATGSYGWHTVRGHVETYINLSEQHTLKPFVSLMKDFKLPAALSVEAAKLNLPPPGVISSAAALVKTLLLPNWRVFPVQFDIPGNSQIFGQLVRNAGVQGILYPSKMTGRECLALFYSNFESSAAFVELTDAPPEGASVVARVDASNFDAF